MYSTTTLVKNSKFSGKLMGTHQQLDQAARSLVAHHLPHGRYFPSSKEIIHFEGSRGPDGLKRKSPGQDEPSHLLVLNDQCDPRQLLQQAQKSNPDDNSAWPPLIQLILDHRWNLVQALKKHDDYRAAFEAAWSAHYIADGLTPAHHFPLSEAKEELMTNKEFVKIFGEPIKGIMHGRSGLETARNNWLYWGAGGVMTKHVAFEYGIAVIAATIPQKRLTPKIPKSDFKYIDPTTTFLASLNKVADLHLYDQFCVEGWTTPLALEVKNTLLPEVIRAITLIWYSAIEEAYNLSRKPNKSPRARISDHAKPKEAKNA